MRFVWLALASGVAKVYTAFTNLMILQVLVSPRLDWGNVQPIQFRVMSEIVLERNFTGPKTRQLVDVPFGVSVNGTN